jgi:hypothetical protein
MIYSYLKKIFNEVFYYKKNQILIPSKNEILNPISSEHICELNFKLTKNEEIDIEFIHSEIDNLSLDEISSLAEKYANLIVLVNNGLLKKQFLSTIKKYQKRNVNNSKITLLLDNILFFNNLLQQELKIIKKENEPLVRPSSVFRSF